MQEVTTRALSHWDARYLINELIVSPQLVEIVFQRVSLTLVDGWSISTMHDIAAALRE